VRPSDGVGVCACACAWPRPPPLRPVRSCASPTLTMLLLLLLPPQMTKPSGRARRRYLAHFVLRWGAASPSLRSACSPCYSSLQASLKNATVCFRARAAESARGRHASRVRAVKWVVSSRNCCADGVDVRRSLGGGRACGRPLHHVMPLVCCLRRWIPRRRPPSIVRGAPRLTVCRCNVTRRDEASGGVVSLLALRDVSCV
jgi:hypothetical protein